MKFSVEQIHVLVIHQRRWNEHAPAQSGSNRGRHHKLQNRKATLQLRHVTRTRDHCCLTDNTKYRDALPTTLCATRMDPHSLDQYLWSSVTVHR